MNVQRFLNYIAYSTTPPSEISAARWSGMLKWYATRQKEGEL